MVGTVFPLGVFDNKLVAGETFFVAGGDDTSRVSAWNGTSWAPLAPKANDRILGLVVFRGRLIAAGEFTTIGGVNANYIAEWGLR